MLQRHGEGVWNPENRFTEVDLTAEGVRQAVRAGQFLRQRGLVFDMGSTAVLKRAIKTLDLVLAEADLLWISVEKFWRLTGQLYGAPQGLKRPGPRLGTGSYRCKSGGVARPNLRPRLPLTTRAPPGTMPETPAPFTENLNETMARALPSNVYTDPKTTVTAFRPAPAYRITSTQPLKRRPSVYVTR